MDSATPEKCPSSTTTTADVPPSSSSSSSISDAFKKIPHGLTYKHETRHQHQAITTAAKQPSQRKSLSPEGTDRIVSPMRHPLTCIKDQINAQKINALMTGAKQDLTAALESAVSLDKENDLTSTAATTNTVDITGSSPSLTKQIDVEIENQNQMSANTIKLDTPSLDHSNLKLPFYEDEEDDVATSSPLKLHQSKIHKRASDVQMEPSHLKKQLKAGSEEEDTEKEEATFKTPSRLEKQVTTTPLRSHHSRLMDDAEIGLKVSESDSIALHLQNSPLANVSQGSIMDDMNIDGETEVIRDLEKHQDNKISINDISAMAADTSIEEEEEEETEVQYEERGTAVDYDYEEDDNASVGIHTESRRHAGETMSPVKLNPKSSPLDIFESLLKQQEDEDDAGHHHGDVVLSMDVDEINESKMFSFNEIEEIKRGFEELVQKSQIDLQGNISQVKDLKEELVLAKAEFDGFEARIDELRSSHQTTLNENQILKLEVEKLKEVLKKSNEESQMNAGKFDKLRDFYLKLIKLSKTYEESLSDVKSSRDLLIDEVSQLKSELITKDDLQVVSMNKTVKLETELKKLKETHAAELKNFNEASSKSQEVEAELNKELAKKDEEILKLSRKIEDNDKFLEQQLEKLAQDLYLQYSAKHEQKVGILKRGYEIKWLNRFKKLTKDNEELKSEIKNLNKKLEIENNEKKQLVKLWEEYVSLENEKSPRK